MGNFQGLMLGRCGQAKASLNQVEVSGRNPLLAGKSTLNCPHLSRDTCFGETVRSKRPKRVRFPFLEKYSKKPGFQVFSNCSGFSSCRLSDLVLANSPAALMSAISIVSGSGRAVPDQASP